jgi:hypothetical protein
MARLAQIQDSLVVAEEHRDQFRIAVQSKPLDDGAVEVADQPVRQEEGGRPLACDRREPLGARVHLIAVRPFDPRRADLVEKCVEPLVHPALSVNDDQPVVLRPQPKQLLAQLVEDPRRVKVQKRRYAVDVHVPSTPVDDLLDLAAERPANDESGRAHLTPPHPDSPDHPKVSRLKVPLRPDYPKHRGAGSPGRR